MFLEPMTRPLFNTLPTAKKTTLRGGLGNTSYSLPGEVPLLRELELALEAVVPRDVCQRPLPGDGPWPTWS